MATEPEFQRFGDSNGDREIYRHKSANVHDIISLTYTLTYGPDVILDRKSLLLWKDINACACTQTHTHTHTHTHIRV